MQEYLLYSLAIFVLGILSAFFSATETAFSSLSKIKLKTYGEKSDPRSKMVAALGENFEKLISTILVGNNIVNIAAATLGTMLFSKVFQNNESLAGIVSTAVVTVFILLFCEVMPKTIAKKNPESVAFGTAPIVIILFYLLYPINYFIGLWQKLINKIFKKVEKNLITDEELITYVDEAEEEGGIDSFEGDLIRSAIEFDDLTVRDALTARVEIEAIDIKTPMDKILEKFIETGYSRMPVYKDNIDDIIGILNEKDFYKAYLSGAKNIKNVVNKNLIMVPLTTKISELLRRLQKGKMHMAVVIGEFGGTSGIITLEDIVEELVGEIWDEHDEVIEPVSQISDDVWEVQGEMDLDEFFDRFDQDIEEEFDAVTVSGFVTLQLERVPQVNDVVKFSNLEFKVTKTEFNRVSKVQVKVLPKIEEKEEENLLIKGIIGNDKEKDKDKDRDSED